MERESNQIQPNCRSGCGFYGNPATDGLCSICHKEALKKKQQVPTTPSSHCSALAMASTTPNHLNPLSSHADFDVVDSMSQSHLPKKKTSKVLTNIPSSNTIGGSRTSINASLHSIQDVPEVQEEVVIPTLAALVNQAAEQAAAGTTDASPLPGEASPASSADSDTGEDKDGDKDKKKKNRCAVCRKKVGLTGFQCRCGGLFCAVHRYSDKHDCSFNYREMGAQEIRRNNPVVVGEKIQKI